MVLPQLHSLTISLGKKQSGHQYTILVDYEQVCEIGSFLLTDQLQQKQSAHYVGQVGV